MSMSTSETSSSDSEVGTSAQFSAKRGTNLTARRNAFEPPQGAVLIGGPDDDDAGAIDTGEFDWDSVKDDQDIELWLVRVPNSVRSFVNLSPFLLSSLLDLPLGPTPPFACPEGWTRHLGRPLPFKTSPLI